jgi:RimJ/RimL family protein N-acetyltransferase
MEHTIRPFQVSDIPDILEIAKTTWGGDDHLPSMLDDWLSDSNCNPYVMEEKRKVVSIANLKIIDQGRTGWMEGLRVHPKFREKGLASQMTKHLVEKSNELNLSRFRFVTATVNIATRKLAESVGMKVIGQYSVFWKSYSRNFKWTHETDTIMSLDKENIVEFVETNPELVPNNFLVYHLDVFDLTRANVDIIAEKAEFWYSQGKSGVGFSLGFKHEIRYGLGWSFTIYAISPEGFLSHLSHHFHRARGYNLKSLMCIHAPEFQEQYNEVNWLKKQNHKIQLLLFERLL